MNWEDFVEKYKPTENPHTTEGSFDNKLFETYGKELDYVKTFDNFKIWTLISTFNEGEYIIPGYHYVDRLGYFITEVLWLPEDEWNLEIDLNDHITKEQALKACIQFFEENSVNIPLEFINEFFEQEGESIENPTIGEAKYVTIEIYEDFYGITIPVSLEDKLHDFYSNLI